MKVFVTGTRGVPDIPGGVEKHCQELYPLIAGKGHEVILSTRKPYVVNRQHDWQRVKLIHTFAPKSKSLEAIVHTFISVFKARLANPDIVHIHAVGPGLLVPLARLMGLRVVVTNHGPDYEREKWGRAAKAMLRLGETLGCRLASEVIVISRVIANIVKTRCNRGSNLIYNGVALPIKSERTDYLKEIGVYRGEYILAVSRFVPEKGLDLLIRAFQSMNSEYKLVIAGDADHETPYSRNLRNLSAQDKRIVLTGYISGEHLNQVYSHARLFVLPSYHEGLPIALLEAMSYGLSVLVSDIPANREIELSKEKYFNCGDVKDLEKKMKILIEKPLTLKEEEDMQQHISEKYNWHTIAEQTICVYRKVMQEKRP